MFYVYIHIRLDTGEIFYVGKGQKKRAWSPRGRNQHWLGIVAKHGRLVHIHSYHVSEEEAFSQEVKLIDEYKGSGIKLVNLTDGGEGASGWVPSAETRARIGEAHRGNTNWLGRTHSVETRKKMSLSSMGNRGLEGRTHTSETKLKMSEAAKGRIFSQETRERMGIAQRKRVVSEETKVKISKANKGKTLSVETKSKMSEARKTWWANLITRNNHEN